MLFNLGEQQADKFHKLDHGKQNIPFASSSFRIFCVQYLLLVYSKDFIILLSNDERCITNKVLRGNVLKSMRNFLIFIFRSRCVILKMLVMTL